MVENGLILQAKFGSGSLLSALKSLKRFHVAKFTDQKIVEILLICRRFHQGIVAKLCFSHQANLRKLINFYPKLNLLKIPNYIVNVIVPKQIYEPVLHFSQNL